MPTITSTRLTKKQSLSTKDAYCVRIERKDGKVIRYTNWDKNLVMSNRINKEGASEALSSSVTYYSLSGYTPSAINNAGNLSPSSFDLEGVLNALEQGSGTLEEEVQKNPDYVLLNRRGTSYSTSEKRQLVLSNLLDNDPATDGIDVVVDNKDSFNYATDPLELDFHFRTTTKINIIKLGYLYGSIYDSSTYIGVQYSTDGNTFIEAFPMRSGLSRVDGVYTIDLPETIECRDIRICFGPQNLGAGHVKRDLATVQFFEKTTLTNITSITREDIRLGYYDFARIYVFITDSENPIEDEEKQLTGFWSETELKDGVYIAEVKSLADALNTTHGRFYHAKCDTVFTGPRCGVRKSSVSWLSDMHAQAGVEDDARLGTVVKPTSQNGFWYKATSTGFVGATEPTWPTTLGNTVVDNEVTWETVYATTINESVSSVTNSKTLVLNSSTTLSNLPNAHFENGTLEFSSGDLTGLKFTIKTYDSTTRTITLKEKMISLPSASDNVVLTVGCKKRFDLDCDLKFGNKKNYQGFPHMPGTQVITRFGGQ